MYIMLFFGSALAMDVRIFIYNSSKKLICVSNNELGRLGRLGEGKMIWLKHTAHKLGDNCVFSPLDIKSLKDDLLESDLDQLYFENEITFNEGLYRASAAIFVGKNGKFEQIRNAEALSNEDKNPFLFNVFVQEPFNHSALDISVLEK